MEDWVIALEVPNVSFLLEVIKKGLLSVTEGLLVALYSAPALREHVIKSS